MKKILIILLFPIATYAQDADSEVIWASPSVEGMNLGKGLVFGYQRMAPYNISSESQAPELVDDAPSTKIERISNRIFKIRLPVLRKDRTQAVVGFEYNVDQFEFEDPNALEYPFYNELHHRNLPSRGLKVYLNHSLSDRKFLFARLSFELNGDIPDSWFNALKYSVSASYGWKLDPRTAWGVGFYFSYVFGKPSIYPGILYNKTWNEKWGIEALFPGMVQLRFTPNENNILYLGYDVFGASYNIDLGNTLNEQFNNIQVRRSEIMPVLRLEKEIYDFIWGSLEVGYRYNLNFNISEDNIFDEKEIIINEVDPGMFVGASIFIIPTESLTKFFTKE